MRILAWLGVRRPSPAPAQKAAPARPPAPPAAAAPASTAARPTPAQGTPALRRRNPQQKVGRGGTHPTDSKPTSPAEDVLRPHETVYVPVQLGRSGTGVARSQGPRMRFVAQGVRKTALRTPYGRVTDRLLMHAFSLPVSDLEGSIARESLRELSEQAMRYIEAARPHQEHAQQQIATLLPILREAMRWGENCERPRLDDPAGRVRLGQMLESLRQNGRLLLPLSLQGGLTPGGHAILLDILRAERGLFTLRVYNTGFGLRVAHHPNPAFLAGTRFQCMWEVKEVAEAKIASLQGLLEVFISTRRASEDLRTVTTNFYQRLRAMGTVSPPIGSYEKPQTAGNCAWKSVMSFIKYNCEELTYRSFKTYVRSRILQEAIAQVIPMDAAPCALRTNPALATALPKAPQAAYTKRAMFATADTKIQKDLSRLGRLAHPSAIQCEWPSAPRSPKQIFAGLFRAAQTRAGAEFDHWTVMAYVRTQQMQVNDEASRRLAARLHEAAVGARANAAITASEARAGS